MTEPMAFIPVGLSDLQKLIADAVNKAFAENKSTEIEKYLTSKDVLDKLQITYPTLKRFTENGKFKKFKIGKKSLYAESQINEAMTSFKRYDHNI